MTLSTPTIRDLIITKVQDIFTDMSEPLRPNDWGPGNLWEGYPYEFSLVVQGDVGDINKGKSKVLAIFDGSEAVSHLTDPVVMRDMTLDIEGYTYVDKGQRGLQLAREMVGVIERRLMEDRQLGNLCLDILVQAIDMQDSGAGMFDKYAQCLVRSTVRYRHHNADPRRFV